MIVDRQRDSWVVDERTAAMLTATLQDQTCIEFATFVGSLAAGLGHAKSDIDVFAFCAEGHKHELQIFEADGWRVDIETHPLALLERLAAVLEGFTGASQDIMEIATLSRGHWDVIARLMNARDMFSRGAGSGVMERLRAQEPVFRQAWLHVRVWEMLGSLEDLWGFHSDGDMETCALWGSELVLQGLEALCVATGNHYLGRKWLAANLRRLNVSTLLEIPRADTSSTVWLIQALLGSAQLIADPNSGHFDWRTTVTTRPERAEGPRRNWVFVPWHTAEGHRLVDISRRGVDASEYSLSAKQLAIWLMCDGEPISAVADRYANAQGEDPAEVRRQLAKLSAIGLVTHDG